MNRDERPRQPSGADDGAGELSSRRKFLRQVGLTTAVAAAAVGAAELAGLAPASAAAKKTAGKAGQKLRFQGLAPVKVVRSTAARPATSVTPDCEVFNGPCYCEPNHCDGACPSGYWCNLCISLPCGYSSGFYCVKGGCDYSRHSVGWCEAC